MRTVLAFLIALGAACVQAQERVLRELKSGVEFTGAQIRALERDEFANPGMLWVQRGEKLWSEPAGSEGKSCASCHGDARASMKGVAARYPAIDRASGRLLNLEGRIQQCASERRRAGPLKYESEELVSLTVYVAMQSRGVPIDASIEGAARVHFDAGRALYYRRAGQMNLACNQCHEQNWGKRLLAETLSQGHPNAFPSYRLDWQSMGSLQRRLRACFFGIRAEMPAFGAPELLDLELFLAWRAKGLAIETPGVRR